MATTKIRTTKPRTATKTKADAGLLARTGRTVKQRPYVSAAIATGAVTAVAVAAVGAFFLSRKDKSFGVFTARVKDGFAEASDKFRDRFAKPKPQSDIAEEPLTLKETGKRNDKQAEDQFKVTAVTH